MMAVLAMLAKMMLLREVGGVGGESRHTRDKNPKNPKTAKVAKVRIRREIVGRPGNPEETGLQADFDPEAYVSQTNGSPPREPFGLLTLELAPPKVVSW